jgi:hypothetical protein
MKYHVPSTKLTNNNLANDFMMYRGISQMKTVIAVIVIINKKAPISNDYTQLGLKIGSGAELYHNS